ncbi:hypothetical protein ACFZCY_19035 [Streptomyces sp. NPDC007983]|uniref:hypothetical protein n=1 Tax=Streptomyces sp. NPDC007983 TaxID=3364800 RepID=UPI0036DFCDDB
MSACAAYKAAAGTARAVPGRLNVMVPPSRATNAMPVTATAVATAQVRVTERRLTKQAVRPARIGAPPMAITVLVATPDSATA